jgi:signal transduction histidine kinase
VKDESQNILYFEGSMEDINQRKAAENALRHAKMQSDIANRAKTEFIANMSHELRTPLNSIIGFSEIIRDETLGPMGQKNYVEYASDIHKSGKALLKIITEILDISKIESGNRDLNESEFPLERTLKVCIDLLGPKVHERQISVEYKAKDIPVLVGEELALRQVIMNIYSNAIKFTPYGGCITFFSNFDHDGSFRLSISDTGMGLDQDEIRKAFSPFGQADNALDRAGAGAGLGLPLSQMIMELHGGRIEMLSEKGIGTSVTMIFPASRVVKTG